MAVSGLVLLKRSTPSDASQTGAWILESQTYSMVVKATWLSMQKTDVKNLHRRILDHLRYLKTRLNTLSHRVQNAKSINLLLEMLILAINYAAFHLMNSKQFSFMSLTIAYQSTMT